MFLLILHIVLVFLSFLSTAINEYTAAKIVWAIAGVLWFVSVVLDIIKLIA